MPRRWRPGAFRGRRTAGCGEGPFRGRRTAGFGAGPVDAKRRPGGHGTAEARTGRWVARQRHAGQGVPGSCGRLPTGGITAVPIVPTSGRVRVRARFGFGPAGAEPEAPLNNPLTASFAPDEICHVLAGGLPPDLGWGARLHTTGSIAAVPKIAARSPTRIVRRGPALLGRPLGRSRRTPGRSRHRPTHQRPPPNPPTIPRHPRIHRPFPVTGRRHRPPVPVGATDPRYRPTPSERPETGRKRAARPCCRVAAVAYRPRHGQDSTRRFHLLRLRAHHSQMDGTLPRLR